MAVSAHDVARELRSRLPGIGSLKLQKLLYYCQGHHLAASGEPLFRETIKAWDNGPVVAEFYGAEKHGGHAPPPTSLTEAQLNTVGYVCSRYGALTGRDLINMTHAEEPWQLANRTRERGGRVRIELEWMRTYFADDSLEDEAMVDRAGLRALLAGAEERLAARGPGRPDSREEIIARLNRGA